MDTIIDECKWIATKVLVFLLGHVFECIFMYIIALCLVSFIMGDFPYKMRVGAGAICVVAHSLNVHQAGYQWVYNILVTILTIEATYIASSISLRAAMQGDVDYWVLAEYIGCILVPGAFVGRLFDRVKDD